MAVTRRGVLEALASESDAAREETTTIAGVARRLDADEAAVERQLAGLVDCELARVDDDGRTRVTITGEELLAIEADDLVIVEPTAVEGGE